MYMLLAWENTLVSDLWKLQNDGDAFHFHKSALIAVFELLLQNPAFFLKHNTSHEVLPVCTHLWLGLYVRAAEKEQSEKLQWDYKHELQFTWTTLNVYNGFYRMDDPNKDRMSS